ncbi:hypothetical protein BH10PSE14_BH10PSE14_33700 [soil metagenome]
MTISLCWRRKFQGVDEIVFASDSRLSAGYRWDCAQKIFPIEGPNFCISFAGDSDFGFPVIFQFQCMVRNYRRYANGAAPISEMTKDFLAIVNQMASLVDDRVLAQFTKTSFLIGGYHFDSGAIYQRIVRYNNITAKYERDNFGGLQSGGKGFRVGFIGDEYAAYFKILGNLINKQQTELNFQPLEALSILLRSQDRNSAIGGSPQVVKVYRHRNYLPYAIRTASTDDGVTLFGRPLLSYERTFYPVIALDRFGEADFVHYPDMRKSRTLQPPPKIGEPPKRVTRRHDVESADKISRSRGDAIQISAPPHSTSGAATPSAHHSPPDPDS